MKEYSLHKLRENEFHKLIPLMQNCFDQKVNIDYFKWKFQNNPAGFVFGFYAKNQNNEIAAYYGLIPQFFIINNVRRTIYQSCDTMTHSNHRRKGLFQKLALHCYKKLKEENKLFIIGFGGGQSTPGFKKFGWEEIFKMKYYFYPKQFKFYRRFSTKGVYEVKKISEIQELLIKSNDEIIIHSEKSIEIYKWRISNPRNDYRIIGTRNGSIFDSYLTYYMKKDKIVLFDFYFSNMASGEKLINFLKNKLNSSIKGIVGFIQENSSLSQQLSSFKFLNNPFKYGPLTEKVPFIFFSDSKEMKTYNNPSNWQINSFEHDSL